MTWILDPSSFKPCWKILSAVSETGAEIDRQGEDGQAERKDRWVMTNKWRGTASSCILMTLMTESVLLCMCAPIICHTAEVLDDMMCVGQGISYITWPMSVPLARGMTEGPTDWQRVHKLIKAASSVQQAAAYLWTCRRAAAVASWPTETNK